MSRAFVKTPKVGANCILQLTIKFLLICFAVPILAKEPFDSPKTNSQKFSTLPAQNKVQTAPLSSTEQTKTESKAQSGVSAQKQLLKEFLNKSPLPIQNNSQQNSLQKKNTKFRAQINFRKDIQVILGDGRKLSGSIKLKVPPQIRIEHSKDEIDYYKDIRMEDIDFIELKAWKGRYLKRKAQGELYRFEVSRYVIHLSSGQSLIHRGGLLPFLRNFSLSNENGEVHLYSYWMDLYTKEESWHTGLQGPLGKERVLCHAAVVKKISFRL